MNNTTYYNPYQMYMNSNNLYNAATQNYNNLYNTYPQDYNNYQYETVETLQPQVTQTYNYVDRYYLITQPHINECITVNRNHYIKTHTCETTYQTINQCDYQEITCCGN